MRLTTTMSGSILTMSYELGRIEPHKIHELWIWISKYKYLWRGKLSLQLKKWMVKSLICSVTLYSSETWTLGKEDIKRLEAIEMWIWRRIERINWMEHWKNVDVLFLVNEDRSLIDTIRQRQKNWIGHILRGEWLLRTVLEGRIPGKKARGRPRMMLLDWMIDGERKTNYSEWFHVARIRVELGLTPS